VTVESSGSSVIVQPVGSQTKATTRSRSGIGVRQVQFTLDDVSDPERLHRVLLHLQSNLVQPLHGIGQNPMLPGNLLQGLVFGAASTLVIAHGLGRPYQGWLCVRQQGNPAVLVETALPTGVSASQMISILSTNAGTYSLWVF
jgi:hypothetical protein